MNTDRFINMKDVGSGKDGPIFTDNYVHNLFFNPKLDDVDTEVVIPNVRLEEVVAVYAYNYNGYNPTVLEPVYKSSNYVPCIKEAFVVSGDGYYRETVDGMPHRNFGHSPLDIPGDCPAYAAARLLEDSTFIARGYGCKDSYEFEDKLKKDQTLWKDVYYGGME